MNVITPSASMKLKPNDLSLLETECLFGETVKILKEEKNWIYGKLLTDNYLGWINKNCLNYLDKPTHRVLSTRSYIFNEKNVKSNYINYLPLGSKLKVINIDVEWAEIKLSSKHEFNTGYVPVKHIVDINNKVEDWVSIAEELIGIPYKWGGRDTIGLDCSALVQLSYETYGYCIPRDTNEQIKIDREVVLDLNELVRGCVIFWNGHVGIMVDRENCLHANAFHMKTVVEPLSNILARMGGKDKIIKMMNFNN